MTEKRMNIMERINAVRKMVPYVKKERTSQGYKAVGHDDVTALLHDAVVEHGILIFPTELSGKVKKTGTYTKAGTPIIRYEAKFEIRFMAVDDASDCLIMLITAHANDTSDKGPGKACSYAIKTAVLKMFFLESGEDEESRVEGERRFTGEKISEEEAKKISKFIKKYGIDEDAFLGWLRSEMKAKSIGELTEKVLEDVWRTLNAKKKRAETNKPK